MWNDAVAATCFRPRCSSGNSRVKSRVDPRIPEGTRDAEDKYEINKSGGTRVNQEGESEGICVLWRWCLK